MNQLTTSEGGSNESNLSSNRDGMSYCAFSGTRQETGSVHGGSSAAIIETVGWGKGNAAQAFWTNSKHVTVGQLYLGAYNSSTKSPDYGIVYGHRPKNIEFWYKYRAKNSADFGKAFVKVLDASGTVLAEKTLDLPATGEYTQMRLDLSDAYAVPGNAGVTLQLGFLSSGYKDVESQNNNDWLDKPEFTKKYGRYTGSSLYIDDIKLNY